MAMPWKLCNTRVNRCCKISIDYWVEKKQMHCVFCERYSWIVVGRNLICVLLPSRGGGGVLPHMTYKGLWRWTENGFLPLCPKQGIYWISCESVVARVYDFAWVCWNGIFCTIDLISLMNFVYKSNDYNVNLLCCNCQQMALKQDGVHFLLCPKHSSKIEGVFLDRVCILGYFGPKQGQGFKPSAAQHLYTNISQVSPGTVTLPICIREDL